MKRLKRTKLYCQVKNDSNIIRISTVRDDIMLKNKSKSSFIKQRTGHWTNAEQIAFIEGNGR